jgi:hypothetical protein
VLAGCVSGVLLLSGMWTSYRGLLIVVIATLVPILACGLALHYPIRARGDRVYKVEEQHLDAGCLACLLTVYLFFVGQTGYLSYVVQQAVSRGMTFEKTIWSLALMKVSAGIWVLVAAHLHYEASKSREFLNLTIILSVAIVALYYCKHIAVFFLGLLAMEIALNRLSARLQAAVVAARSERAGRWLTGIMLLGAASGPPLTGFMISIGLDWAFVLGCVISGLGPLLWQQWCARNENVAGSLWT